MSGLDYEISEYLEIVSRMRVRSGANVVFRLSSSEVILEDVARLVRVAQLFQQQVYLQEIASLFDAAKDLSASMLVHAPNIKFGSSRPRLQTDLPKGTRDSFRLEGVVNQEFARVDPVSFRRQKINPREIDRRELERMIARRLPSYLPLVSAKYGSLDLSFLLAGFQVFSGLVLGATLLKDLEGEYTDSGMSKCIRDWLRRRIVPSRQSERLENIQPQLLQIERTKSVRRVVYLPDGSVIVEVESTAEKFHQSHD